MIGAQTLPSLSAEAPSGKQALAGLSHYIERVRSDWRNVGLAVAVVQGSEVIYAHGFGLRQVGKAAAVDQDTLFQVGSTTKAFTCAALSILVDEGKLRWDDAVTDYVPTFALQDAWLTQNLTIRDTLSHRSGISDRNYFATLGVMSSNEVVRELRYIAPEARFRDSYRYSNWMYAAAGKVIEATSGMSWHDFVRRRLLEPLVMSRSGTSPFEFWDAPYVTSTFLGSAPAGVVSPGHARDSNVAMPHVLDDSGSVVIVPWQSFDNAAAAGSIVSSAADMAHWVVMHLNEGRFENRQVLAKEAVQELHALQNLYVDVSEFPFADTKEGYAMGWRRAIYRGRTYLAHSGGIVGFPAYVALLPDAKVGVVVLSNGPKVVRDDYTLNKAIVLWAVDRLLGAPSRDWRREFLSRAQKAQQDTQSEEEQLQQARLQNSPPSLSLAQYAGIYEDSHAVAGRVSVRLERGQLVLSFPGDGAFSASLEHWHQDLFRLRSNPASAHALGPQFAVFALDPAGKVISLSAFDATFQRLPESLTAENR
jgi:CubicO group peptidase (beta-lactamase class C family)